jgi:hypothetical protein
MLVRTMIDLQGYSPSQDQREHLREAQFLVYHHLVEGNSVYIVQEGKGCSELVPQITFCDLEFYAPGNFAME